jgi:hypothetical protein
MSKVLETFFLVGALFLLITMLYGLGFMEQVARLYAK